MTITAVSGQETGNRTDSVTSNTEAFTSNVTAGNLIVVYASKGLNTGAQDAFVVGDCTQSAGTATITDIRLDASTSFDVVGGFFTQTGIWSAVVTGTGSCTMQIAGAASVATICVSVGEYSTTDAWAQSASRIEDTSTNTDATDNANSTTGSATSAGNGLFAAVLQALAGADTTLTLDTNFTQVFDDGTATGANNSARRIVSTGTTDSCDCTLGTHLGYSAGLVVYKELPPLTGSGTPSLSQPTASGVARFAHDSSGTPSLLELTASGNAGLAGSVVITDVNTTETWTDGDTGLVITGSGFV